MAASGYWAKDSVTPASPVRAAQGTSLTFMLRVWARSSFAESPEEITRIIYSLLNREPMK